MTLQRSYRSIQFKPDHIDLLEMREHEKNLLNPTAWGNLVDASMVACSFLTDGRLLMVAGFMPKWDGVIELWILPSIYVMQYAKTFMRICKTYIAQVEETIPNLHRIETTCKADRSTDQWMERLGFHCEGTHLQFTANRVNYRTWARYPNL